MAKKIKGTAYIVPSVTARYYESRLLTRDGVERMLAARSDADAARVLEELGYTNLAGLDAVGLEEKLSENRRAIYDELEELCPSPLIIEFFKIKYDYHNVKVILKAEAADTDGEAYLSGAGRFDSEQLKLDIAAGELEEDYPEVFSAAVERAKELLSLTSDSQLADFVLDRAYFEELFTTAKSSGSSFLLGYSRLLADIANLRVTVRGLRQGKDASFIQGILVEGGDVDPEDIVAALRSGGSAESLWADGLLMSVAGAGFAVVSGGRITDFERQCDNTVIEYMHDADLVGYGEQPVVSYLHALDTEMTTVRIIMTGRMAGLTSEQIRERLRDL